MTLSNILLSDFRNYNNKAFTFSPTLTIVVGPNTAGKTSLLEAIMLIATGKSFRADRDREMISFDKEVGRVVAKDKNDMFEIVFTTGSVLGKKAPYKKYTINKVSKRLIDFVGQLPAVLFWPEDLRLITGSPSRRRQYLDTVLSQTSKLYRRSVSTYEKALRIRNKLLRLLRDGDPIRPEEFEYWTDTLFKQGAIIHKARNDYIDFVNTVEINQSKKTDFTMCYDHSTITKERLEKYKSAEQGAAVTLIGPHRDDFYLTKNHDDNHELHSFGSRGEQRLGVLWLKIAELAFIENQTDTKPLLLLDDIFSELDKEHRDMVMELVNKQQTIMTTTDEDLIDKQKGSVIIML